MSIPSPPLLAGHSTNQKKEVVLKLRLAGTGGSPQIRRVRLPRIQESNGQVSYAALVDVAINCTFPETQNDAKDFDCILTYYDIDNDCVTIASTEELVDAIEQFSSEECPVLRITTDVKKKEVPSFSPPENSVPPATFPASVPKHFSEQPTAPHNAKPNQLQHIVESCVSVLAAAVMNLKDQVAEMNPSSGGHVSTTTQTNQAANVSTLHMDQITENELDAEHLANEVVANMEMKEEEPTSANVNQEEEERPFIHGRHTCDGCLCTPIVGIRYHSTNLPDYDLCAKCRDNYKGNEIQFDAAELDRDRPFQERWHRKRTRFSGRRGPNHSHRGPRGRGQCSGPGRRHCHPGHLHWFRADPDAGMDAALKEAIRRSLQDVHVEKDETPVASTVSDEISDGPENATKVVEDEASTSAPDMTASNDILARDVKSESTSEIAERNEIVPVVTVSEHKAVTETSFSSDAVGHGFVAETLGHTLDECAQAIDAMVSELDRQHPNEYTIEMDNDDDSAISGFSFPKVTVENTSDEEAASGEKIIDCASVSERDVGGDDKSEVSEDEWQVVQEDAQIANDEVIARAAQLIGSALFQSDLRSSEDPNASTLTSSGELGFESAPSSVPSLTSNSQISFAVLDRWALQLSQLHDLGFHNDVENVDILERIKAAKIGVDDDDEVSVTQVVNMLLKYH